MILILHNIQSIYKNKKADVIKKYWKCYENIAYYHRTDTIVSKVSKIIFMYCNVKYGGWWGMFSEGLEWILYFLNLDEIR